MYVQFINVTLFLRLEHPQKLIHVIFEKLYEEDVVSEEAFLSWSKNDNPAEQVIINFNDPPV